tara:strand:+ start:771 stop:1373 length:603 start_codon:yes stop_codon:yes gene_type:complete
MANITLIIFIILFILTTIVSLLDLGITRIGTSAYNNNNLFGGGEEKDRKIADKNKNYIDQQNFEGANLIFATPLMSAVSILLLVGLLYMIAYKYTNLNFNNVSLYLIIFFIILTFIIILTCLIVPYMKVPTVRKDVVKELYGANIIFHNGIVKVEDNTDKEIIEADVLSTSVPNWFSAALVITLFLCVTVLISIYVNKRQ